MIWWLLFTIILYIKFKYGYKEFLFSLVAIPKYSFAIGYSKEDQIKKYFPEMFKAGFRFVVILELFRFRFGVSLR